MLSCTITACSKQRPEKDNGAPSGALRLPVVQFDPNVLERLGIHVETAGSDEKEHRLHLPGTLEYVPDRYAEVGSILEGRVTSLNVRVGDNVKKNQALGQVLVPTIVNAQADLLSSEATVRLAREHARRETSLLEKQLTTAHEAEVAQTEEIKAEAQRSAATARLQLLGAVIPTSNEAIHPNGSLTLRSPLEGVIVARRAVLGGFLQSNETAFIVADLSTLWAMLDVFESDVPYVQPGATVDFSTEAIPDRIFKGHIDAIEPHVGKESRALRARVVVNNQDGVLKPGFFVRASLSLPPRTSSDGGLLLPTGAVQPLADQDVVFVELAPGRFEVRTVVVARRTTHVVDVRDGINVGERIVVRGAFVLRGEVTKQ